MIIAVEIGWQREGRYPGSKVVEIAPTGNFTEAFDQAVERLKLEMLLDAARRFDTPEGAAQFIASAGETLRLRPWCVEYRNDLPRRAAQDR